MANHKQALKRHRQSLKRHERNQHFKTLMKNTVKKAVAAQDSEDKKDRTAALREAESMIQHVAAKGLLPKKRASRKVSRLARHLQADQV